MIDEKMNMDSVGENVDRIFGSFGDYELDSTNPELALNEQDLFDLGIALHLSSLSSQSDFIQMIQGVLRVSYLLGRRAERAENNSENKENRGLEDGKVTV